MSTALASAERWLLRAVTAPARPRDLGRLGRAAVPAQVGLDIYRNAYRSRLVDCLADDFPALRSLLGAETFATVAERIIRATPPTEATLNRFGRRMVAYLRGHPQATACGRLALDLARLEWAIIEAIHAPLGPTLEPAAFASIPADGWQHVQLQAAPSLRLIASRWPVDACYRQYLSGADIVAPGLASEVVAVVRCAAGLERRRFSPGAGRLIVRLARGRPLGDALAGCRLDGEAVGLVLRDATSLGCFSAIRSVRL
jgi:hypothetical protein